jgi:hypothetical protein
MRKTLILCGLLTLFSTFALAENWTGRLMDANCYTTQQTMPQSSQKDACNATGSTSSFAVDVSGKIYKFDADGNRQAAAALKNRADRSTQPQNASKDEPVTARVSGKLEGDTIKVESLNVM